MNTRIMITLVCTLLMFQACKKDEKPDPIPPVQEPPKEIKEKIVEIKTNFGTMYMWLYKETPLHRDNFLKLASDGFYTNTTFHRIIPKFMIQGGDPLSKDDNPNNDGTGGPGYDIPAEFIDNLKNIKGAVATARLSDNINPNKKSNGSQFFINVNTNAYLDKNYTVFGFIIKGIEVADTIVLQPRNASDRPNVDIKMEVNVLEKTKEEILSEYGYEVK